MFFYVLVKHMQIPNCTIWLKGNLKNIYIHLIFSSIFAGILDSKMGKSYVLSNKTLDNFTYDFQQFLIRIHFN